METETNNSGTYSSEPYTAYGLYPLTLSTILPSTGQNKHFRNIHLYETAVLKVTMANHELNHRCLIEKQVHIVFILTNRWHYRDVSLGIPQAVCVTTVVKFFHFWGWLPFKALL